MDAEGAATASSTAMAMAMTTACPTCHECPICRMMATSPVVTSCGHTFCWACLYPWLQNPPKPCPVCGTTLTSTLEVIPVYGSLVNTNTNNLGDGGNTGTNAGIPPRPGPPALGIAPLRAGEFPTTRAAARLALDAVEMMNKRLTAEKTVAMDSISACKEEVEWQLGQIKRAEFDRVLAVERGGWDQDLQELRDSAESLLGRMVERLHEKRLQIKRVLGESARLEGPLVSLRLMVERANDDLSDWWPDNYNEIDQLVGR